MNGGREHTNKTNLTQLVLMRVKLHTPQKYCTPVMFSHFVCALLIFRAYKFPIKTRNRELREIIVERTLYMTNSSLVFMMKYMLNPLLNSLRLIK